MSNIDMVHGGGALLEHHQGYPWVQKHAKYRHDFTAKMDSHFLAYPNYGYFNCLEFGVSPKLMGTYADGSWAVGDVIQLGFISKGYNILGASSEVEDPSELFADMKLKMVIFSIDLADNTWTPMGAETAMLSTLVVAPDVESILSVDFDALLNIPQGKAIGFGAEIVSLPTNPDWVRAAENSPYTGRISLPKIYMALYGRSLHPSFQSNQ